MNLDKLKERKDQLEARIKNHENRLKENERKARTRRLIIWGTVMEKAIQNGQMDTERWKRWCEHYTSDRDRKVATNY
ncbi:MAG: mobilization protein [Candidatus Sedimenticola sp. (ex Thyasira tokunagai)]